MIHGVDHTPLTCINGPGAVTMIVSQQREYAMGIEVGGLLGLIWLIIIIWAIVKVAKSPAGPVAKLLWILLLLFLPLLGLILWLLLGPKG